MLARVMTVLLGFFSSVSKVIKDPLNPLRDPDTMENLKKMFTEFTPAGIKKSPLASGVTDQLVKPVDDPELDAYAFAGAAAITDKPVANKMEAVAIEINFLNIL